MQLEGRGVRVAAGGRGVDGEPAAIGGNGGDGGGGVNLDVVGGEVAGDEIAEGAVQGGQHVGEGF